MKKILIVAGTTNRLLDVLIDHLSWRNWMVQRIQQHANPPLARQIVWGRLLIQAVMDFLGIIKSSPDVTAFHFYGVRSCITSGLLAVMRKRYVVHFWGSDYFYWKYRSNLFLKFALKRAQRVTFANTQMLHEAEKVFGADIRYEVLRFGLEALELIDTHCSLPVPQSASRVRVVVGTNSQVNQQHLKIIEQLEKIDPATIDKCRFIFPLNYGDRHNREAVLARLKKASFPSEVLDNYIVGKELACFRCDTDILIQLQKTDAMSGAMLETIYAGGKVLTGAWLPYDDLRQAGIQWFEINQIDELPLAFERALNQAIDEKYNREAISKIARWEALAPAWDACYCSSLSASDTR